MKIKKMDSYKKMGIIILLAAIAGGIIGGVGTIILGFFGGSVAEGMEEALFAIQRIMLPLITIITVLTVVFGEWNLKELRAVGQKVMETEDEECDRWEYEEEKVGAKGAIANVLSQIFGFLAISAGYSLKYMAEGNYQSFLKVCIVFVVCEIYNSFWQVRYVKLIQKIHPEKQGDPSSLKFQKEWLESCDEAEREIIYRSAYTSYMAVSKSIPFFLILAMLGHLFFDTGLMAIVMVALVWLVLTISYLQSCVKLKKGKLVSL